MAKGKLVKKTSIKPIDMGLNFKKLEYPDELKKDKMARKYTSLDMIRVIHFSRNNPNIPLAEILGKYNEKHPEVSEDQKRENALEWVKKWNLDLIPNMGAEPDFSNGISPDRIIVDELYVGLDFGVESGDTSVECEIIKGEVGRIEVISSDFNKSEQLPPINGNWEIFDEVEVTAVTESTLHSDYIPRTGTIPKMGMTFSQEAKKEAEDLFGSIEDFDPTGEKAEAIKKLCYDTIGKISKMVEAIPKNPNAQLISKKDVPLRVNKDLPADYLEMLKSTDPDEFKNQYLNVPTPEAKKEAVDFDHPAYVFNSDGTLANEDRLPYIDHSHIDQQTSLEEEESDPY
jgi:hypothetical protein